MDHFYQDIPGFTSFEQLYREQVEDAPLDRPSIFVELGTCLGRSAAFMGVEILNSGKPIVLDTWDSWVGCERDRYGVRATGHEMAEMARANLAPVASTVLIRTGDAIRAANRYLDGECDFVFIDDDHESAHVLDECRAWWPKLRSGGTMAGHDFTRWSVSRAVHRWSRESGVKVASVAAQNIWVAKRV